MSGYVKIYGSILDSSVWAEPPATRCVWMAMLAMADKNGRVEASPGGLARRANVTDKQLQVALDTLMAPDTDSKSPEYDGRRVEVCDRGWLILNYLKYRELQTEKQAADAARAQAYRDRLQAERDASRSSHGIAPTVDEAAAAVNSPSSSSGRWKPILEADMADRLTTDAGRIALAGILTVATVKSAVIAELNACLGGARGKQHECSLEQLDLALSDYFGNGMSNGGTWNANHFRGCIRTAMRVPAPDIHPARPSTTKAQPDDAAQGHVSAIRSLIRSNGPSRFIPRSDVEAMGPAVLSAYLALGGADRFLNVAADKLPFLVRDFAALLRTHAA